jgi:hypothetical protein
MERISDPSQKPTQDDVLQFEVDHHDDILRLVDRMRARGDFPKESAEALVVGLKLFSEVMLQNRHHPLFVSFAPHFKDFMSELKGNKSR